MTKLKIVSVTKPEKDELWSIYRLILTDGKTEWMADMSKARYEMFLLRQKFLDLGVDEKDLEEFESLAWKEGQDSMLEY